MPIHAFHTIPGRLLKRSALMMIATVLSVLPRASGYEAVRASEIHHMADVEEMILAMTNEIRKERRLNPLQHDASLRDIARKHSDDMIIRKFFEHTNPDGHDAAYRISTEHRRLIGGNGENIWRYATTLEYEGRRVPTEVRMSPETIARRAIEGWMNSPGHRENILRPQFTHLGVGVSIVKGEVTITQNFGSARAFLNASLPGQIKRGAYLDLETSSFPSSAPVARMYDFWSVKKKEAATDPIPVSTTKIEVGKGQYYVRFFFPVPDGYEIFWGPRIDIR